MVRSAARTSSVALALYAAVGHGASLPIVRRAASTGFTMQATSKGLRHMTMESMTQSNGAITLNDFQDLLYIVNVSIGGDTFPVQLDTGSTDLWVFEPNLKLNVTNNTGVMATESYGSGTVNGPIAMADVQLGPYAAPNQAFINAASAVNFGIFQDGAQGILGLGFEDSDFSPINFFLEQAWGNGTTAGRSTLGTIFAQNPSTPNSFDFLLDRATDINDPHTGTFLVSEHLDQFANVVSQPKLPRVSQGRWTVPADGMKVNGKPIQFNQSSVPGLNPGQLAVVLDSGFTNPPLPPAVVDAMYSSIPGAVNAGSPDSTINWLVPCDGYTEISFIMGGQEFPIHPLDLTVPQTIEIPKGSSGATENVTFCSNTFQYLNLDPTTFSGFDAIFGDAFLRNSYASFHFGSAGDTTDDGAYVQLVPTTTFASAIPDFKKSRLAALQAFPPTIDPQTLLNLSNAQANSDDTGDSISGAAAATPSITSSSSASSTDSDRLYSLVEKYGPIIIGLLAGNILIGVILVAIGLGVCLRGALRGGARTRTIVPAYNPVRTKDDDVFVPPMKQDATYHD